MSTPSPTDPLHRPPYLSCIRCTVDHYTFRRVNGNLGATTEITFCSVHKQNFRAPPILPDGASAPTQSRVPGVTSRMPPARRDVSQGAADGTATAVTRAPTDQRNQQIRPANAALNPNDALRMYENVRDKIQADQVGLREALTLLRIDRSTFRRKRVVAEAMIVDPTSFLEIRERLARTSSGKKINQEDLLSECKKLMKKPALEQKLRLAVSDGRCI